MLEKIIITIIACLMLVGGLTLINLGSKKFKQPKMPVVILGLFLVFFSLFPMAMCYTMYNDIGTL